MRTKVLTLACLAIILYPIHTDKNAFNAFPDGNILNHRVDSIKLFDGAVALIKHYEQWHSPKHYPYVAYGHRLLAKDNFSFPINKTDGELLLINDLKKNMSYFKGTFSERLLMGMLAYNIGQSKVLKSTVYKMIQNGGYSFTELKANYICWCMYNGKHHRRIHQRRIDEFELIYKV